MIRVSLVSGVSIGYVSLFGPKDTARSGPRSSDSLLLHKKWSRLVSRTYSTFFNMVSTRQITRLAAAQLESASPSVARGHKRKRGVASIEELGEVTTVAETIEIPIVPKPKKKKEKKKPLNEDEGFSPTQEPTYVIPDVERKTTTFRGRLGGYSLVK